MPLPASVAPLRAFRRLPQPASVDWAAVQIGSVWPALLAGGLYALSPLVWTYSVQAEVFAMNNMFAALLLLLILRFNERRTLALACGGAFTIGLGLTNQHTLVLFALPLAAWALAVAPATLATPRAFAALVAAGLAGLLPYAFLLAAGNFRPLGSWGSRPCPCPCPRRCRGRSLRACGRVCLRERLTRRAGAARLRRSTAS